MNNLKTGIKVLSDRVICNTYRRLPIVFMRGRGCTLWDDQGRKYTDFLAGIAVCNLGHSCPEVASALCRQADTLFHVSNLYYTVPQTELADWLVSHSFADRVFFANSGAEANEAAIKLARKFFFDQGKTGRCRIIAMENSFHGRTFAALSATGQKKVREGFEPILEGFDFVPFNDVDAVRQRLDDTICAVLIEPIQGEGGVRAPDPGYLESLRDLCDETGTILIFDEIQTGIGRTGKFFAYEHFNVTPDIMTLAKALGNGLPIGAMLATEKVASAFSPGAHASTFGGTPVITAAALEVVRLMEREQVVERCARIGAYFKSRLEWLAQRHEIIEDVRGMGLMLGMRLSVPGASFVSACLEKGFIINCIQENILRFVPPLIITEEEIDSLIECLDGLFSNPSICGE
ncbi:MAG: aspartate aminotransferase family protein [Deltaproteobacteria bacterium]|nr:aspartate aminotransferase family protein [Deltaproteobacteria bacterium]